MRKVFVAAVSLATALVFACSKDPPPPATPIASAQPANTAPPPATGAPAGTGVPGQMAVPGPTAMACQNDSQCLTHKCNVQYGKCAFPCQSDVDCIQGTSCFLAAGAAAFCAPKPAGT